MVQVNPASNKEIKISQATKVSVVEAKPDPPIIVSKVQVIEEVKPSAQVNIISKVEVVTEAPRPVSFWFQTSQFKQQKTDLISRSWLAKWK